MNPHRGRPILAPLGTASRAPRAGGPPPPPPEDEGVAIVGGGISGLALGWALAQRGIPFHLFEASPVPGGVIRSVELEDRVIDLGPQRVRLTPEFRRLVEALGLPLHGVGAFAPGRTLADRKEAGERGPLDHRVWIGRNGELHPLPTTPLEGLRSRLLSPRGKLRMAMEPFVPGGNGDTSAQWLRRRVGDEAYRAVLGPLFGGLYGSDPETMEAQRVLLPALREMGADRSLILALLRPRPRGLLSSPPVVPAGGMASLPWALARALGDRVSLGTPVEALVRHPRGGWVVGAASGAWRAREVVLALPPDRAAALLLPWAPEASGRLRRLRMNPVALVHLALEPLPPGLGFQVAFGEEGRLRGMTFSGHLDGSGSTAVAFLGGMRDPEAAELHGGRLSELAALEATRWTGSAARPLHHWRTRMPAWDRSFQALDGLTLPPGIHLHANYVGRPGIVGRLREAERLAAFLARQRAGSQAQAGSAASGSPFMA